MLIMLVFLCGNFVGVEQPTCTLIFTPTLCFLVKEMKKSSTQHPCLHDSFGNWKILHPPRKSSFIPLSWCDTFGPCTTYEHIIDIVHTYTPLHWNAETWHPLFWLDMLTVKRKFLKKKQFTALLSGKVQFPFFVTAHHCSSPVQLSFENLHVEEKEEEKYTVWKTVMVLL